MKKHLNLVASAVLFALCALPSLSAHATPPTKNEISALFSEWNKALATGDSQTVTSLYAPDGVLLPTVSNDVRTTPDEIKAYFDVFLKLKPQGVIDEENIQILDDNSAINSGVYTFTLVKDGKPEKVQARYTYVYEKMGDKWLIKNHHSSAMPETTVPANDNAQATAP
jgi:uncharacterized protein (TIGR02246 family)